MKYFKALVPIFIIALMLSCLTEEAKSQPYNRGFGLGVVLGEPTGITAKTWLGERRALAATGAWSLRGNDQVHLALDYQSHNFDFINVNRGSMALYYGLGGRVLVGDNERAGVRVPFGLAYFFENDPFEIFLELVPILDITPATEFTGNSGLGVRLYF